MQESTHSKWESSWKYGHVAVPPYSIGCEPVKNVWVSPWKMYKGACEKHPRIYVFHGLAPYGVGRYCNMAVSPTRSHLLCNCFLKTGMFINMIYVIKRDMDPNSSINYCRKTIPPLNIKHHTCKHLILAPYSPLLLHSTHLSTSCILPNPCDVCTTRVRASTWHIQLL